MTYRARGEQRGRNTSRFLFLLVVHDHHLHHFAERGEVIPKVCFGDVRRQTAKEHLWPVDISLRLLHASRVAWLRVNLYQQRPIDLLIITVKN